MKILYTSDLHISAVPYYDNSRFRSFLLTKLMPYEPDYIILGGDICEKFEYTMQFFSLYRREIPNIKTALLTGNHDLWSYQRDTERETIYNYIHKCCKEFNITFLEEEPIVHDKTLLCGTNAWYDYSAKPEEMNIEYLMLNKRAVNNDGTFIISNINDLDYAKQCQKKLFKNIKSYKDIDNILVFTHVPVFKDCIIPTPYGQDDLRWRMGNSYFYNLTLGKQLLKNKKIKLVVSGHIHRYMSGTIDHLSYVTCGSDYEKPEGILIDFSDSINSIDRIS